MKKISGMSLIILVGFVTVVTGKNLFLMYGKKQISPSRLYKTFDDGFVRRSRCTNGPCRTENR